MTPSSADAIHLVLSLTLAVPPAILPTSSATAFSTSVPPPRAVVVTANNGPAAYSAVLDLSLLDAVQMALQRNTALLQNSAGRVAERFDLAVAGQQFSPIVSVTGSVQQTRSDGVQSRVVQGGPTVRWGLPTGAQLAYALNYNQTAGSALATPGSSGSYNLSLTQPLLKGAGLRVAGAPLQLARWQEQINRLRQQALLSSTISDVITSYRSLQRAVQAREIAALGVVRAAELIRTNQALVQSGRLAASELLQTQADQAAQQLVLAQAGLSEITARLVLAALLRLDGVTRIRPSDDLTPPDVPSLDVTSALALTLERQPDYQQSLLALQQSELQRDVAANAQRPDVSLTLSNTSSGSIGNSPIFGTGTSRATTVGVLWTVPFNDLSVKRAYVQAQATLVQARLALEQSRLQIEQAVYQSLQTIAVLAQQLDLSRTRLDLSRRKLALELEKLKAGRSSNFQVLTFQADLRQAELGELDAKLDYMNALTALDRLQGTTLQTWSVTIDD